YVVCEEPRVVVTFFATPLECDVLSFEHYWYGTRAFSNELGRADDAILATLQIKQNGACAALPGAAPLLSANEEARD
ncbi:MAG: hypothetical protein ABW133_07475, partial [Polyangiaceae bacterium]